MFTSRSRRAKKIARLRSMRGVRAKPAQASDAGRRRPGFAAYQRGGSRVAAMILRPAVVDFLELATPGRGDEVDLEEIKAQPGSRIVGRRIGEIERESPRLRIVALRCSDKTSLIPNRTTEIQAGDYLVAIGDRASLS